MGRMGNGGAGPVDVPPQAEYQLDLADRLASSPGDHVGRSALVGERPDRRITLAERV